MFDNIVFDSWLTKKSDEILSKVDREKITTEEMIILLLKAQTNHFHHMDDEFREEFGSIKKEFGKVYQQFGEVNRRFEEVHRRFESIDRRFEVIDQRFERIDQKFDRQGKIMMWGFALITTLISGLYLKLLL